MLSHYPSSDPQQAAAVTFVLSTQFSSRRSLFPKERYSLVLLQAVKNDARTKEGQLVHTRPVFTNNMLMMANRNYVAVVMLYSNLLGIHENSKNRQRLLLDQG